MPELKPLRPRWPTAGVTIAPETVTPQMKLYTKHDVSQSLIAHTMTKRNVPVPKK
jgi:hypothetical protein